VKCLVLTLVFAIGAVVFLALTFDGECSGSGHHSLTLVLSAFCIGGLAGTLLGGRFRGRLSTPWGLGLATSLVALMALYVVGVFVALSHCSA